MSDYLAILVLLMLAAITVEEKLTLKPPQLSEEEQRSTHMPLEHKCDGCKAVAHQIGEAFKKAHEKLPKSKELREYDVIELIENVCKKGFEGYGLATVEGYNRLTGPGLDADNGASITQMGGWWPRRLQDMCSYYKGEIDESDLYESWKEDPQHFPQFLCNGDDVLGICKEEVPRPPIPVEDLDLGDEDEEELHSEL